MPTTVRRWPAVTAHLAALPAHAPGAFESVSTPHSLAVSFTGHRGATWSLGDRTQGGDLQPGAMQVVAAAPVAWLRVHEPALCLELVPSPALLAQHGGTGALANRCERDPWLDPLVLGAALRFQQAAVGARALDDLEAEQLMHRMLARALDTSAPPPRRTRHLDHVLAWVDAHLGEPFALADLAAIAGTTVFHFARTFRRATGAPPHAFVTARRMHKALDLLRTTALPVAAIARLVGYESTSHFHRAFRRQHGRSPAAARADDPRG